MATIHERDAGRGPNCSLTRPGLPLPGQPPTLPMPLAAKPCWWFAWETWHSSCPAALCLDMDHSLVHFRLLTMLVDGGDVMRVSVSEAKGQLTELVRRAEAGDDVVLTRHGQAAVRLVPVRTTPEPAARRNLLEALRRTASVKAVPGPEAARSQDGLYGDDGLPE